MWSKNIPTLSKSVQEITMFFSHSGIDIASNVEILFKIKLNKLKFEEKKKHVRLRYETAGAKCPDRPVSALMADLILQGCEFRRMADFPSILFLIQSHWKSSNAENLWGRCALDLLTGATGIPGRVKVIKDFARLTRVCTSDYACRTFHGGSSPP